MTKYELGEPGLNRYLKDDLKVLIAVAEGLSMKYPIGSEHWQVLNRVFLDCENLMADTHLKIVMSDDKK